MRKNVKRKVEPLLKIRLSQTVSVFFNSLYSIIWKRVARTKNATYSQWNINKSNLTLAMNSLTKLKQVHILTCIFRNSEQIIHPLSGYRLEITRPKAWINKIPFYLCYNRTRFISFNSIYIWKYNSFLFLM